LRKARICILDEATASVDMETDAMIQKSLRENFDSTIFTIAHRLNTIIDYDRVMVLSFGKMVEMDTPANLLRNPSSIFSKMVADTGDSHASQLREIAFQVEKKNMNNMNAKSDNDAVEPITALLSERSPGEVGSFSEDSTVTFHE